MYAAAEPGQGYGQIVGIGSGAHQASSIGYDMSVAEFVGSPPSEHTRGPLLASLRLRILVIAVGFTTTISAALSGFITNEFKGAVEESVLHEGLLFSDALEASIVASARRADYSAIQAHLDRLMEIRGDADIEVNVIVLDGASSTIVASH